MKIKNMKVNDLIPYENNPRNNEQAIEYVANSIKQFGFKVPIVVDKNNVIVAGHTRWLAAQALEMDEVPVVVADDLTDAQVKAFRLADNKTAEFAEWDVDKLVEELDELTNFDMSAFGFDLEQLATELITASPNNKGEIDLDDYTDDKFECTCPRCGFQFNRGS